MPEGEQQWPGKAGRRAAPAWHCQVWAGAPGSSAVPTVALSFQHKLERRCLSELRNGLSNVKSGCGIFSVLPKQQAEIKSHPAASHCKFAVLICLGSWRDTGFFISVPCTYTGVLLLTKCALLQKLLYWGLRNILSSSIWQNLRDSPAHNVAPGAARILSALRCYLLGAEHSVPQVQPC